MKANTGVLLSLVGLLFAVACADPQPSTLYPPPGAGAPGAVPPPLANCLQYGPGQMGNGCQYGPTSFGATGWQPYPTSGFGNQFINQGFSGCQPPMVPVVMGAGGVACANANAYPAQANYAHANINPTNWTFQTGGPWGRHSAWIACSVHRTDQFGNNLGCPQGFYCEPANGNPGMQNNPLAQASGMGLCRQN